MSWTLCTSGAAIAKAGTHANSTIVASGATLLKWSAESEGFIDQETRRSWTDNYSTLSTAVKNALSDVCSSKVAMNIIAYDTTGYLTREADTLMNLNDGIVSNGLKNLREMKSNEIKTP